MRADNPIGAIVKGGQPNWSFDMQGSSVFWVSKADELHRMVELGILAWRDDIQAIGIYHHSKGLGKLHHRPSTLMVSFLLASLAIENLLKAIVIREHPEYVKDGRFHGAIIGSHDLKNIAHDAGVALSDDEQDLVELGTECILSFGRYAMAKNVTNSPTQVSVKDSAFSVYERLFERLKTDINDKPFVSGA
jgi:hypothetical protein